jgi:hypothetical protein
MKLYTFYTDSHKDLLYKYFLPSLYEQENAEVIIRKFPQECPSAEYGKDGWFKTMLKKVEYHIQSCQENYGKTFIYSDCDVQFLKPFVATLIDELGDYDIACQNDVYPYMNRNTYCAGFFICKASDTSLAFFEKILYDMLARGESRHYNDQVALNENLSMLKHKILSNRFYTIAQTTHSLWTENYNIKIPSDIIVHHANWTHGVSNKIKLLNFIREQTQI